MRFRLCEMHIFSPAVVPHACFIGRLAAVFAWGGGPFAPVPSRPAGKVHDFTCIFAAHLPPQQQKYCKIQSPRVPAVNTGNAAVRCLLLQVCRCAICNTFCLNTSTMFYFPTAAARTFALTQKDLWSPRPTRSPLRDTNGTKGRPRGFILIYWVPGTLPLMGCWFELWPGVLSWSSGSPGAPMNQDGGRGSS